MEWWDVLRRIRETLHLERAIFSGVLCLTPGMYEWKLDSNKELASAIATYLVDGGECPLNAMNAEILSQPPHLEYQWGF